MKQQLSHKERIRLQRYRDSTDDRITEKRMREETKEIDKLKFNELCNEDNNI